MNDLLGSGRVERLRQRLAGMSPSDRQTVIVSELVMALNEVGGRYVLPFEFKSPHGERTSHYVIFVTKRFRGFDIMKDVMYSLSSDEGEVRSFEYVPARSRQLQLLFDPEKPYSIAVLKELLVRSCFGTELSVRDLHENYTIDTPYMLRNLKDAIIALEAEGRVVVDPPAEKRPKRKGEVTLANDKIVSFPS